MMRVNDGVLNWYMYIYRGNLDNLIESHFLIHTNNLYISNN